MKQNLEDLFKIERQLMDLESALDYIDLLVPLKRIRIPSGTKLETWEVPNEWFVRDAWVKFKGKKIIDYKKQPLSLMVGSVPFHKTITLDELRPHLNYLDESDAVPYTFSFYESKWGFNVPKSQVRQVITEEEFTTGTSGEIDTGIELNGKPYVFKTKDKLEEGDYEVFIDSGFKKGNLSIGVHTIEGKTDREILLFAHLDHPHQANDNLSGVCCLLDLAEKIKSAKFDHTIKIVFCPETLGSIAYALTEDISKVDFVVAVDICGNNNNLLLQKPFDAEDRLYRVAHVAIKGLGEVYRQGPFRSTIGSDEYAFNDPLINIPGILLSRWPYPEYHTADDTPEKIDYEMIEKTGKAVLKIIDVYEKDYVPVRMFKGPLFRQKYGVQAGDKQTNLSWDYLVYFIDGKKSLAELCCAMELNFELVYDVFEKMVEDKIIKKDAKSLQENKTQKNGRNSRANARKKG